MKKVLSIVAVLSLTGAVRAYADADATGGGTAVQVNINNGGGGFTRLDLPSREFSIDPGIAIQGGSIGNYADNSFSLDADWFHRIHPVVQFGTELGYIFGSKLDGTIPSRVLGNINGDGGGNLSANGDVNMHVLHITPEFKIGPMFQSPWGFNIHPFVVGGGGLYWTHYTSGNLNVTGTGANGETFNGTSVSYGGQDDVNGGWNVGGGISMTLPADCSIGVEVRYHHIMYSGGAPDMSFVIPALRLTLLFP